MTRKFVFGTYICDTGSLGSSVTTANLGVHGQCRHTPLPTGKISFLNHLLCRLPRVSRTWFPVREHIVLQCNGCFPPAQSRTKTRPFYTPFDQGYQRETQWAILSNIEGNKYGSHRKRKTRIMWYILCIFVRSHTMCS